MAHGKLSRRRMMGMGLNAAATAGLVSLAGSVNQAQDPESLLKDRESFRNEEGFATSFHAAYSFLDTMMDAYAQGATVRLAQSYTDQQGLLTTGFIYDNALVILAYLLRGRGDDLARARTLGDGLLYAQQHDANFNDGRLRQGYFVDAPDANGVYLRPALDPFFFIGSAVGDLSWAGMALAQLYGRTRDYRYLDGAVRLGNWIFNVTFDSRGPGGYNFGVDGGNSPLIFKSTEHNIDVHALFKMLAVLTRDQLWLGRAQHARDFVSAMWNSEGQFFWTGTGTDGVTINQENIPADTQTWSFMSLPDDRFADSIDWAQTNLSTIDTPQTINSRLTGRARVEGSSYASISLRALAPSSQFDQPPDPNAVWLEGSAHLAAALLDRGRRHEDRLNALMLLDNIRSAQERLGAGQTVGGKPLPDGQGVIASSSVLNTGFGFSFYPNLHLAATSWYLIAGQSGNPFRLFKK